MKILIAGAGGAPSEGVINSLLACEKNEEVIGMGSEPTDLVLSHAKRKYHVPYANHILYQDALLNIIKTEKPDLVHFQNDLEIFHASQLREAIHAEGTKTYMPSHEVIDTCVHKYKTYLALKKAGIKVPETVVLHSEEDLQKAMADLGDENGKVWLRASSIGGGGKGAAPTNDFSFARAWIERFKGWGDFTASQMLTADTVTWLSIWYQGELVVAQTRIRKGWTHGNRSVSGVTGVTKVGQTFSDPMVDEISIKTVKAVDGKPHGIFGVDMTYDKVGIPNPTEINISRFFTTVLFFTAAGLNMPKIFKDIILYNEFPSLAKKLNPLKDGLMWLRGMDTRPRLMTSEEIEKEIIHL
jgi:predicted ATP-grasp superfamily ATP-dependent carboligase